MYSDGSWSPNNPEAVRAPSPGSGIASMESYAGIATTVNGISMAGSALVEGGDYRALLVKDWTYPQQLWETIAAPVLDSGRPKSFGSAISSDGNFVAGSAVPSSMQTLCEADFFQNQRGLVWKPNTGHRIISPPGGEPSDPNTYAVQAWDVVSVTSSQLVVVGNMLQFVSGCFDDGFSLDAFIAFCPSTLGSACTTYKLKEYMESQGVNFSSFSVDTLVSAHAAAFANNTLYVAGTAKLDNGSLAPFVAQKSYVVLQQPSYSSLDESAREYEDIIDP